ncbi:MAG: hypothetical protein EDQ89_04810 [Acidobacteria bacterium]|nr:MAG: hypothetical protein EDQ89_04810 [Acidobacteriota bacterium]GIK77610.1 MAG: hypothetical protein BroJett022_13000 [Actinomycetes bacterium]
MAASAITAISNGEVILIVTLVVAPIAAMAFAGSGAVYRQIGRGRFAIDRDRSGAEVGPAPARAAREAEIRQMLEAKAFRRRERGGAPIDIDAELARLTAPAPSAVRADPALAAEVRGLVVARNARRVRQGRAPLDVDAEVERQLRDLEGPGR